MDDRQRRWWRQFLDRYPFLPYFAAYLAGIVVCHYLLTSGALLLASVAFIAVLACVIVVRRTEWRQYVMAVVYMLLGFLSLALQEEREQTDYPERRETYEVVVMGEPSLTSGGNQRADIAILSGRYAGRKASVVFSAGSGGGGGRPVGVGETVVMTARLEKPRNYGGVGAGHFDYESYMAARGMSFSGVAVGWEPEVLSLDGLGWGDRARLRLMTFRHMLTEKWRCHGLRGEEYALVSAMSVGDKSSLDRGMREGYARAGLSHVLALSGMHLSVIYFLLTIFADNKKRRSVAWQLAVTGGIWAYVFLVGMPSSVVRAALMLTICSLAIITMRGRHIGNSLLLSAFLMTLVNPRVLFDCGFQLSYVAVASIVAFTGPMERMLGKDVMVMERHPMRDKLLGCAIVSFAAQLGTAPLVAYYFGSMPVYSLIANYMATPAVVAILVMAIVTQVAYPLAGVVAVLEPLAALSTRLLWLAAWLFNGWQGLIASLPMASVGGIDVGKPMVVVMYTMIIIVAIILSRNKKRW